MGGGGGGGGFANKFFSREHVDVQVRVFHMSKEYCKRCGTESPNFFTIVYNPACVCGHWKRQINCSEAEIMIVKFC
jgi:hypothetical protein